MIPSSTITLFQTIPEQGSQEENTAVSNTDSILKPHCNSCKFPEKKKICFTPTYVFIKAS